MDEQRAIDDAYRYLADSFKADELKLIRIERLLNKYPKTTPDETWAIIPILFVRGILDAESLRKMPYEKFLRTEYWAAVSWYVKDRRPWCVMCCEPISAPLEVHHRTYNHRGSEWQHLDDLSVVCRDCHEWFKHKGGV